MAIHGFSIDDAELQKAVDNIFAREMRKIVKAGEEGARITASNTIDMFYRSARKGHEYYSIPKSLKVKAGPIRQDSKIAWSDIEVRIDENVYENITRNIRDYRIYHWAKRKKEKGELNESFSPGNFVLELQWESGVVGLPDPYPNYSTSPLKLLMIDEFNRIWKTNVNRLLR